ncbi:unnamed protein product [Calicophoron daubneyi]|uniref:Rab9 effector protein with kelch motifs n=1 Tax=Calicophoron daubneyi TaxID=300641 RepID=A0AAV2TE79_CALDB
MGREMSNCSWSDACEFWGVWRSLDDVSESILPAARVGHTVHVWYPSKLYEQPILLILGGADPAGTFNEVHVYEVSTSKWTQATIPKELSPALGRYEHTSVFLHNKEIVVFGGATKDGPLDEIISFQLCADEENPTSSVHILRCDRTPSRFQHGSRTQHSCACLTEFDQLIVFSGGGMGSQPVPDLQVHMYDTVTNAWSIIPAAGSPPCPRFGHLILYQPPKSHSRCEDRLPRGRLFVHGGMAEDEYFDDFYLLDFSNLSEDTLRANWMDVSERSEWAFGSLERVNPRFNTILERCGRSSDCTGPCARAAHGGTLLILDSPGPKVHADALVFLFGGIGRLGALNDMFCFSTGTYCWTEIKLSGLLPQARLDFACCSYIVASSKEAESEPDTNSADTSSADGVLAPKTRFLRHYFFIHGGMDTDGNVFNDAMALLLAEEQVLAE